MVLMGGPIDTRVNPTAVNIPAARRAHYVQLGVGHYGVFNDSRFRREVAPRVAAFVGRFNG